MFCVTFPAWAFSDLFGVPESKCAKQEEVLEKFLDVCGLGLTLELYVRGSRKDTYSKITRARCLDIVKRKCLRFQRIHLGNDWNNLSQKCVNSESVNSFKSNINEHWKEHPQKFTFE